MMKTQGLDLGTLTLMLEALEDFTNASLPLERRLELDHEDLCPEEFIRSMCGDELGVQLAFVPEEHGGMGGGAFDSYRICERLARIDLGIATSVFATFLGSDPLMFGGTREQKDTWLGRIVTDGILLAYGATEPEAGSDLAALTTTATPVRADGLITGYRLNGRKQWISNGSIADACTILALAPEGPSWFVVEKGTDGFSAAKPEDKHGIRLSDTAALYLDDVVVPAENLVGGQEGKGLVVAQLVFGYTRVMVAAFGLGAGWAALDRAIGYSTERVQGGRVLAEKQGYTHKLIVPHAVRLEAARAVIEETAARIDGGEGENGALNTEGAIAKYLASEAGNAAAEAAIQAHGGYGYTRPYVVEKIKRDVRITTIYEGTSEILEMTIARDRWQHHLKTGGAYYRDAARRMTVPAAAGDVGADIAALGLECLAGVLDACRAGRLTRNQHVLLRLGELMAYAEGAAAMARRAAEAARGELDEKADRRFEATALAAISRVFARDAALKVAEDGLRLVRGALPNGARQGNAGQDGARQDGTGQDGTGQDSARQGNAAQNGDRRNGTPDSSGAPAAVAALPFDAVHAAQAGLLDDMDLIADVLYGRHGS